MPLLKGDLDLAVLFDVSYMHVYCYIIHIPEIIAVFKVTVW